MGYRRLSLGDRYQIEVGLQRGDGINAIARLLGVHGSTVSREVREKMESGVYRAEFAQEVSVQRRHQRANSVRKIKGRVERVVTERLRRRWSPQQIAKRLRLKTSVRISHQTIYRFLYRYESNELRRMWRISKRRRRTDPRSYARPKQSSLGERKRISERPAIVEERSRLGDWERDTVFGKKNGNLLLTLVDRRSRYVLIRGLPFKSASLVKRETEAALEGLIVHTITNDNGSEFGLHKETEKSLGAEIFFSNAYRSWERGTIENTNGLIREYFPRLQAIESIDRETLDRIEFELNNRPRKCLGYRTPAEVHRELAG